jgi:hypothetical protein
MHPAPGQLLLSLLLLLLLLQAEHSPASANTYAMDSFGCSSVKHALESVMP